MRKKNVIDNGDEESKHKEGHKNSTNGSTI